ncbi:MAG TPA: PQQ-binding-like beta-propeller repeat protein [Pseudonocardiaceae bacterium]|jgi:outer membrane protein assembly factor BamB|nr:PQQ-binding-like beta-propeller repeat protein [Pseudonocardiaceae bacterium]
MKPWPAVRRARALGAIALLACAAGCASTSPPQPPSQRPSPSTSAVTSTGSRPAVPAQADWPTYHRDNTRSGDATDLAPVSNLALAWHAKLDGAVYGQPLVVGSEILAATENDTVYALDPATGKIRWQDHLGTPVPETSLPCGDIDPLGITSTMAYDAGTGRVFALAETTGGQHTLFGINAATGAVEVRTDARPPSGSTIATQQRSALTVYDSRVYLAYGGLFGDCGDYIGSVVSFTTGGTDPISYSIPTSREGGMWAPGGAVLDGDRLLYAVGNGAATSGAYDGSDSVIALSPATLSRLDFWAPATWPTDNAQDLDLGSASPVLLGSHVLITGKRPTTYVLDHAHLGGVGGGAPSLGTCRAFGGASVAGNTAYLPCRGSAVRAVTVAANGTPTMTWTAPDGVSGSPVVGGGAVWVVDPTGTLYALDQATGAVRGRLALGEVPHFASPTLAGRQAYVGTVDGVVAISGA